ncbi:MAG: DUF1552 domain-containing protein [Myxococcota bacterium]
MARRRVTRRQFLRGVGGAAIGLPLLNLGSFGTKAFGEGMGAYPKRLVILYTPNGVVPQYWFPTPGGDERTFTLASAHADMESLKDKLTLVRGLNLEAAKASPGGMHQQGMGALFTGRVLNEGDFIGNAGRKAGWASGVSLDQYIADKTDDGLPFKSLELGVRTNAGGRITGADVMKRLSYTGSNRPLPPQDDPALLFRQLFSDQMTSQEELTQLDLRRQSILDTVKDQLASVQSRAGYQDRLRLEHHLENMRDLERRIGNGASCSTPNQPPEREPDSEETMEAIFADQLDLLAVALACDLTRVATFQVSNSWNPITFPWLEDATQGHSLSHRSSSVPWEKRIDWCGAQFAKFLKKLDATPEGDGTLLDNTLVLWSSEVAVGNTHSFNDMPLLFAGSAGGMMETGRYVQYSTPRSMNDVYIAVLKMFGIDEDSFGDARFVGGMAPGLV